MSAEGNPVAPRWKAFWVGIFSLAPVGCEVGAPEFREEQVEVGSTAPMSFETFLASVYKEPWENGVYVYNGDTPAASLDELREAHAQMVRAEQGLAINRVKWTGADDRWSDSQKRNLTYCIGASTGSYKSAIVEAMAAAASPWEKYVDVDFVYASAHDGGCSSKNLSVVFDVQLVSGTGYLARAFFPSHGRASRNLNIDVAAFSSGHDLRDILAHELGHILGFRHEHTRPQAGQCYEDSSWRELTPYEQASVMHYPQCGGSSPGFNHVTDLDLEGAQVIYGSTFLAPPLFTSACGTILPRHGLPLGQGVSSCDGRFLLRMQVDGNLVLFQNGTPIWSSGTQGQPAAGLYLQADGNLVISTGRRRVLWSSGTSGNTDAYILVQDDGNVVIYRQGGIAVWSTNTCCR
jgi:hypothetical protein